MLLREKLKGLLLIELCCFQRYPDGTQNPYRATNHRTSEPNIGYTLLGWFASIFLDIWLSHAMRLAQIVVASNIMRWANLSELLCWKYAASQAIDL
ncbi:MAG: hypothetical protein AMJ65_16750 [Phycisphaerae bacterium SG8_4]|nr:MAG: hypothetical protein AMJ65_16750 [Phycisphaerae bacterium SG8_4]